jgi:hypothetical protein
LNVCLPSTAPLSYQMSYDRADKPAFGAIRQKFFKKLWHRRHHMSQGNGVDVRVDNLLPTFGLPGASFTTWSKSTISPTASTDSPQFTHTPTHLPRWADIGLSPASTAPNTVARISPRFLLRRSHLGTHRFTEHRAALRRFMSARSISFQVEPERSTVVQRQPVRSSLRIGDTRERHRETAG